MTDPAEGTPLHAMRVGYADQPLRESDLADNPQDQFQTWLAHAVAAALPEPNAMVLATTNGTEPSARTVLLKGVDSRGFTFFTNRGSRKASDLASVPMASLVFPWFAMSRQVIVRGPVVEVPREESAEYFASRPRGSQLGAWASQQSSVIDGADALEQGYADVAARWPEPEVVPLPDHWGGFLVMATSVEFWAGRQSRLHDRLRYLRSGSAPTASAGGALLDDASRWSTVERLSP